MKLILKLIYIVTFYTSLTYSLTSDGLSLLALKSAISKDPSQTLLTWSDSDSNPCSWAGITCDPTHNTVTSISLSNKNLTGYIPSEIGALSNLTALDISHNYFTGPLPHHISTLKTLTHLDVSSNKFNGSLPEGLSNLTLLKGTLNLSYNEFSGQIPASFGLFPVMVSLDLRFNNLSGKIPEMGSLLNQGPTAFSGNLGLCGFPLLDNPCSNPEAKNPSFLDGTRNGDVSSNGFVEERKIRSGYVIFCVVSGVLLVFGVFFVSFWVIRKKWKKVEGKMGKKSLGLGLEVVGYDEEEGQKGKFVVMDEGFSLELEDLLRASAYVVGKSKSGIVYRVVVGGGKAGTGTVMVAVRRLSEGDSVWRFKEFEAEVEGIGKVQHPNIVRLRAYYYASDEKLVITDFIRNGSLYTALHGGPANTLPPLSWAARLRIIQETARALTHIHDCTPKKYVHGNIKSSKILLDDDLKPYISGFGLSRLMPGGTSKLSNGASTTQNLPKTSLSSTIMYLAPEARPMGTKLTQKCDVYAFGIVLMEILTGRELDCGPDNYGKGLEGLVRKVFREERPLSEIIDPSLLHEVHAKRQVIAAFHIALNCTESDPELRPRMRTICDNLDCIKLE